MQDEYRQQLALLVAGADLPADYQISYKPVFGAAAAYANGHIFVTRGRFGLALKLAEDVCRALMAEGVGQPLRYFPKGHVKRNYVVLLGGALHDQTRLRDLLRQSAAFVQAG